jgi:hypothetical protein
MILSIRKRMKILILTNKGKKVIFDITAISLFT